MPASANRWNCYFGVQSARQRLQTCSICCARLDCSPFVTCWFSAELTREEYCTTTTSCDCRPAVACTMHPACSAMTPGSAGYSEEAEASTPSMAICRVIHTLLSGLLGESFRLWLEIFQSTRSAKGHLSFCSYVISVMISKALSMSAKAKVKQCFVWKFARTVETCQFESICRCRHFADWR